MSAATHHDEHPELAADPLLKEPGAFHPHVVPVKLLVGVITALLCLTVITVLAAKIELGGPANVLLAMFIATIKASMVVAFFMHLWWDKPINALVLMVSLAFLALFLSFANMDGHQYKASVVVDYAQKEMATRRSQLPAPAAPADHGAPPADHGAAPPGEHGPVEAGPVGPSKEASAALRKWATRQFGTLPPQADNPKNPITPEKVALGRVLYHDPRLSKNQDVSCATCHDLAAFGIDPRPDNAVSLGHKGQKGTRNSPTVYNAALQTAQFWDSREPDVEGQAKGPMINPVEMAMKDHAAVVAVVKSIPGYAEPFKKAFPEAADPITIDTIAQAIAAFERKLITPAPFDRWLAGDDAALSLEAFKGLEVYKQVNCLMCHNGNLLGGNMQQKLGLQEAWEGNPDDGKMFKVPSLRNVAKTAPYLHDGSVKGLGEVTEKMAKYQLGAQLSPEQTQALVAFMEALTGTLPPAELIGKPELPPSGPETPKPDPN